MSTKSTSIIFTGDIGFDKYMTKKWEDEQLLSPTVLDFFHSADHVCANVEGALLRVEEDGTRSAFFHTMDPYAISVFQKMHTDIWSIGNNHIMDAEAEGVQSTLRLAAEHGVKTVGAGMNIEEASSPVYLSEAGGIGILCVTYTCENAVATETTPGILRWDDRERIAARIAEIKSACRWCVVIAHGGEEFAPFPLPYTRDRYLDYLNLGADVVVGHHPHVPENYETVGDKAIFYSLGNFIFDTDYQRAHEYTDRGVLLKLIFTEESFTFEALGTVIKRGTERIDSAPLPSVFANVSAEEYALLAPLAAKAFVQEERRKMVYLDPKRFSVATPKEWNDYFFSDEPDGYTPGSHMDLSIVLPFSEKAEEGAWKQSALTEVKDYIFKLL